MNEPRSMSVVLNKYKLTLCCKYFIVLLIIFPIGWSTGHGKSFDICGYVKDAHTYEPLPFCKVGLANSLKNTKTDSSGHFILEGVPMGTQELVVSMIGYQPVKRQIRNIKNDSMEILFFLLPQENLTKDIEYIHDPEWESFYQQFSDNFLGTSLLADMCEIVNPQVIIFDKDFITGKLRAKAKDLIIIENRALGYRVHFFLEEFYLHGKRSFLEGVPLFEPLVPAGNKEMRAWQKKRENSYNGSLTHFLYALIQNNLKEEGFLICNIENLVRVSPHKINPLTAAKDYDPYIADTELPFEKKIHFQDYLQVVYKKGMEDKRYIKYIEKTTGAYYQPRHNYQISWIKLKNSDLLVSETGFCHDFLTIPKHGYWAWVKVAEMLPFEFYHSEQDQ